MPLRADLYEPINTLTMVAENIWVADGPLVWMDFHLVRVPFPTRMTVIRFGNGDLWLHSPIEMSEALRLAVDTLGPVRHLVSPNKLHYVHLHQWGEAYPEATQWASPGLRERVLKKGRDHEFDKDLGDEPESVWAGELDQVVFRGNRFVEEVVFYHRSSGTLVLTDLVINFEWEKVSWPLGGIMKLVGGMDPDGKTPLELRVGWWGRKHRVRESLQRVLEWEPERILLAHGRWYRENGGEELRRAFRWLA